MTWKRLLLVLAVLGCMALMEWGFIAFLLRGSNQGSSDSFGSTKGFASQNNKDINTEKGATAGPSEASTKDFMAARIAKQSEGRMRLVSLRKTNGRNIRGADSPDGYVLDYEAEIEFTEDCYWSPNNPTGVTFETVSLAAKADLDRLHNPDEMAKLSSSEKLRMLSDSYSQRLLSRPLEQGRKGQRVRHAGKVRFEKTERGWEG